jgi:hypothetical protein
MRNARLVFSSGNEAHAGGLFSLDDDIVTRIDFLPTAGLHQRGEHFYRIASQRQFDGAEMLIYDARGIRNYVRLDDLHTPHDLTTLDDGTVVAVSPRSNAIVAIGLDGATRILWAAKAPFDAWHVNCVAQHDGRLYATAFGRFDRARGWNVNCDGTGRLFDVVTNEDVVTGLTQPHTPRWIDGAWTICDSGSGGLVRVSPGGQRHRVELGGYPRGLCVVGPRVYVGVSERRTSREQSVTAHIVVLERSTWTELERIPVEAGSVYDIVPVDLAILDGLRVGFHVPSRRRQTLEQLAMFEAAGVRPTRLWALGERLSGEDCRITIEVVIPPVLSGGDIVPLHCTVTNRGRALLVTAPPYPVLLSYKWIDRTGGLVPGLALRTPLPATLPPGQSIEVDVFVAVPATDGRYTLILTGLQEFVHWFDDVDPSSAYRTSVEVTMPDRRAHAEAGAPPAMIG